MKRQVIVIALVGFGTSAFAQRPDDAPPPRIEMSGEAKQEEPLKAGTIIMRSGEWDRVADEAGQVYLSRGYKGVVPGVRDEPAVPSKVKVAASQTTDPPILQWVGFQPFATYSRVFLQLTGQFTFSVLKPRPNVIEVTLPGTRVATPNDERHLVTREFPTTVDRILIEEKDKATVIRIVLKAPAAYLYRQEGQYLFVDISL